MGPRGACITVVRPSDEEGFTVRCDRHRGALAGRADSTTADQLRPLLHPRTVRIREHPHGARFGVVPGATDDRGVAIPRDRDRVALSSSNDGSAADQFGSLLRPLPTRAGEHPPAAHT